MRRGLRTGLALLVAAVPVRAQVVRGVVREADTQAPVPGVIVSLDPAGAPDSGRGGTLVRAVLTDDQGRYSVQAANAGRYVVTAKRVGLKRFQSPPLALGVGEARSLDIVLTRIDIATTTLATVDVVTDAPCTMRPSDAGRVASLWEETRAALTATQLALRDRMFRATSVRYTRQLHPSSLRILQEDQVTQQGLAERLFRSLDAAVLSRDGFVQVQPDGASVFYAPDADVLAAPEFVHDHCFSVTRDTKEHRGLAGLAFQPVRDRAHGEIRGTMWLDSATYELRSVEFRFVNLANFTGRAEAGGEVRFSRLPNGTWFVSRWFIRMPEFRAARPTASLQIGSDLELVSYREEGGNVTAEGVHGARLATLVGRALDSTGRAPLRAGTVRLAGTQHQALVRPDGSFRLESLPAGAYTLTLDHPAYAQLGMRAAEQDLEVTEGTESVTALQAVSTALVLQRLCNARSFGDDHAVARVRVLAANEAPVAGASITARYDTYEAAGGRAANLAIRPVTVEATTDAQGATMLCDVPARRPIRIAALRPGSRDAERQEVTLAPSSITVVTFRP